MDKFRVTLRKNTAVCIRNNTTVVLVLQDGDMDITLDRLEKELYFKYSFEKTVIQLIKDFNKINYYRLMLHDLTNIDLIKLQDNLIADVNLLAKECKELKLTAKNFTQFTYEIKEYLEEILIERRKQRAYN